MLTRRHLMTGSLATVPLLFLPRRAHADVPAAYTITDLGALLPFGLSPIGPLTVGSTLNPQIAATLFPLFQSLGTLGGDFSRANGAYGEDVVGYASLGIFTHGFRWRASTGMLDLFTVDPDDTTLFSAATDINGASVICGYGDNPTRQTTIPLVWLGGSGFPVILPTPNNAGHGAGINDHGDITGDLNDAVTNQTHAALWPVSGGFVDCHTTGNFSLGFDINLPGQVVGNVFTLAGSRGFVWLPLTGMLLLNPLPEDSQASAVAINDDGLIVGGSSTPGLNANDMGHSAAVRYVNGVAEALLPLCQDATGWELLSTNDVNNQGFITGQGLLNDVRHAFLLTPSDDETPLPEPEPVPPDEKRRRRHRRKERREVCHRWDKRYGWQELRESKEERWEQLCHDWDAAHLRRR
jgi:Predicted integral membrane proteins containing uncharacterized repeats